MDRVFHPTQEVFGSVRQCLRAGRLRESSRNGKSSEDQLKGNMTENYPMLSAFLSNSNDVLQFTFYSK